MNSVLLLVEGCNYFRESLAHVVGQEPDLEVRQAGSLAEGYVLALLLSCKWRETIT